MAGGFLEMRSIYKTFPGIKALQNVDFCVDEGEVVALVGENGAGKSTLMNILGGVIKRDSGTIWIRGKEVNIHSVADAQREGIAFIHQELSLFKQMSVQENLFIDDLKSVKSGFPILISKKKMRKRAEEIFKVLDISVSPKTKAGRLPMSEQQMVEIASAIIKDAKIIILDEPTTSLAIKEREKLHEIIRRLKSEGKLIIYITHELDNAIAVSDRVVCLRDGKNAGEGKSKELTKPDVVAMMIGSKAGKAFVKTQRNIRDEKILEVKDLKTAAKLNGVNMHLKKGEVLGIYGLMGSGRTELIKAIYGLDKLTAGEIYIDGRKVERHNPNNLKKMGLSWVTENRRDEGLFLELNLPFNICITDLEKLSKKPFNVINRTMETEITQESIDKLRIATPSIEQLAGKLSGGNQQKTVLAKWLHLNPRILILDEPTKGIDVGAKEEIYRLIDNIANQGVSIIFISSEIEEIIGMSDRVIAMSKGKAVGELTGDRINNANIIQCTLMN
jgi:ribose transport system ATP-binding protein